MQAIIATKHGRMQNHHTQFEEDKLQYLKARQDQHHEEEKLKQEVTGLEENLDAQQKKHGKRYII